MSMKMVHYTIAVMCGKHVVKLGMFLCPVTEEVIAKRDYVLESQFL